MTSPICEQLCAAEQQDQDQFDDLWEDFPIGPTPSIWLQQLDDIPCDWAMLPLDGNKTPVDPRSGLPMAKWSEKPGYTADEIREAAPKAVGVLLGPVSGGLLAIDFDGPGSEEMFRQLYGRPSTDLPQTISWTSGKTERRQIAFVVDQDWWSEIKGGKSWRDSQGETVLELRWKGQQSAFAGVHPETRQYYWLEGCSPKDIPTPHVAPDWLLLPLVGEEDSFAAAGAKGDDVERATAMLAVLPPNDFKNYDKWLKAGMALHSVDDGLLHQWVEWSAQMENFDEAECLAKWESFGKRTAGLVTIGSLHFWAKSYGYKKEVKSSPGFKLVPKGSRGVKGGKVDWVIDEFLAKGATLLLAAQAGSGKTSLLYAAAAAVEKGGFFLDQIQTKKGRALIIQGDEPENDCYSKLKIMDLEGAFDIVFPSSGWDFDWFEEQSRNYDLIVLDSATSLLAQSGIEHEDPEFSRRLYRIGKIISENGSSCIITTHLRKSADGMPRRDITNEDIAGRATISNAITDCWGLMRASEQRWDDHFVLKCLGKRNCVPNTTWELQGGEEDYYWGMKEAKDDQTPRQRKQLRDKVMHCLGTSSKPLTAQEIAGLVQSKYEYVRRCCKDLFIRGFVSRHAMNKGEMGRPKWAYSMLGDFSTSYPPGP